MYILQVIFTPGEDNSIKPDTYAICKSLHANSGTQSTSIGQVDKCRHTHKKKFIMIKSTLLLANTRL